MSRETDAAADRFLAGIANEPRGPQPPSQVQIRQKQLQEAVETYWTLREAVDELNPFSSYDTELRGPELNADLNAAGYLVAHAAGDLLDALDGLGNA